MSEYLTEVDKVPVNPNARKPNPAKLAYDAFLTSGMKAARVKIHGKSSHYVYMYLRELAKKNPDAGIKVTFVDNDCYLERE